MDPLLAPDGRPYGLILIGNAQDESEEPRGGSSRGRGRASTGGGGGGSSGGSSRRVKKEPSKDEKWARESGLAGWPMYSKDWLIRSVLSFTPRWDDYTGVVSASR